jgi:hypothetical protein
VIPRGVVPGHEHAPGQVEPGLVHVGRGDRGSRRRPVGGGDRRGDLDVDLKRDLDARGVHPAGALDRREEAARAGVVTRRRLGQDQRVGAGRALADEADLGAGAGGADRREHPRPLHDLADVLAADVARHRDPADQLERALEARLGRRLRHRRRGAGHGCDRCGGGRDERARPKAHAPSARAITIS